MPIKSPPLSENWLETAICHLFRVSGLFFWKNPVAGYFDAKRGSFRRHTSPYVRRGVPDLIVVHRGKFYGVEVKTPSGRQSEYQREFEQDLVSLGGAKYFIARSIEDGQAIVKEIKGD